MGCDGRRTGPRWLVGCGVIGGLRPGNSDELQQYHINTGPDCCKMLTRSAETPQNRAQTTTYPSRCYRQSLFPGVGGRGSLLDPESKMSGEEVRMSTLITFPDSVAGSACLKLETDSRESFVGRSQRGLQGGSRARCCGKSVSFLLLLGCRLFSSRL